MTKADYHKQYYEKHKEEIKERAKKWNKEHKDIVNNRSKLFHDSDYYKEMTHTYHLRRFCSESISLVENYEKAKADNFVGWNLHHRLETHNSDGEQRPIDLTMRELIALGVYLHRPADELIFLTMEEHQKLHKTDKKIIVFQGKRSYSYNTDREMSQ